MRGGRFFPPEAFVRPPSSPLRPASPTMSTDEEKKEDDRPFMFPGGTPVVFKKRQLGQKRPFLCAPGELPKVGERFEIDVTGNDRWFRMFGLVTRAFKNDLAAMNGGANEASVTATGTVFPLFRNDHGIEPLDDDEVYVVSMSMFTHDDGDKRWLLEHAAVASDQLRGGADVDAEEWLRKNVGFVISNSYYHDYEERNMHGVHGGTRGECKAK